MQKAHILLAILLLTLSGPVRPAAGGAIDALVSVAPLALPLERIGGRYVRVRVLVPPGRSPHDFELSPRQVAGLGHTRLFLRAGMPVEDAWLPRIRSVAPNLLVVDLRTGLPLRRPLGEGRDHAAAQDTHIWTSPPLLIAMAARITDTLSALDPQHRSEFHANYSVFERDMNALDGEIRHILQGVRQRSFLVYHPAWGNFAAAYGLTQVAVEHEGKEPGARSLAGIIDRARRVGIRVILVQPQFSPRAARQVARAIGARVVSVDPLDPDVPPTLLRLARVLAEAGR